MAFSQKLLNTDETIRLDLHPHWWYLAGPSAALLGAVVFAGFSLANGNDVLKWIAIAALVVTGGWMLIRYLKWISTNFVITNQRVIFRQGIISKKGVQIPLDRVTNVNFSQRILERMIGTGDLLIESAGEGGQQRFCDIKHPDQVTNLLHEAMETKEARHYSIAPPATAPAAPTDAVAQLEKLEGLLQRGSITPEEFEAQKHKLLG